MAVDDDIGTVIDERGDTLEAVFWSVVFLFTLGLFVWEFALGALDAGHLTLQPIGAITEFAQTMWISGLIGGGGVVALIVFAVFRFGSGVRDRPAPLAPKQGSFKFAVYILAVLAIVSTTIFVGAGTLAQTDEAGPAQAAERLGVDKELEMSAVAGQWFWRFDVQGIPATQGEQVVLPAETIIQFQTTSADVIHSFAIKELGVTKDAMPGQSNQAWFYVGEVEGETEVTYTNQAGETQTIPADSYQVTCAELCGKGHSKMLATVYIVGHEEYEAWAEAQGGEAGYTSPDNGIESEEVSDDDGH